MVGVFFGIKGRIGRRTFLASLAIQGMIIGAVCLAVAREWQPGETLWTAITQAPHALLPVAIVLAMLLSATTQRANDIGMNAIYFIGLCMGLLLPVVNVIVSIGVLGFLACAQGSPFANAHGWQRRGIVAYGALAPRRPPPGRAVGCTAHECFSTTG